MYTILVDNKNCMHTSVYETILQETNLSSSIRILVPRFYEDFDMNDFKASIRYKSSDGESIGIIDLQDPKCLEKENGYLQFMLPVTIEMTKNAGLLNILMSFTKSNNDDENSILVRKISPCNICITPIGDWSGEEIPDSEVNFIDQKLTEIKEMIDDVKETQDHLSKEKADDISYENNVLQLTSNDNPIGRSVKIENTDLVWKEI